MCTPDRCQDPEQARAGPARVRPRRKTSPGACATCRTSAPARDKSLGDLVSTRSCTPSDWEQLAIDDPQFDLILAALPGRFSVHYPTRPAEEGPQLADQAGARALQGSRSVASRTSWARPSRCSLIGRASPDGDRKENHDLAVRRMDMVTQIIGEVVNEGPAPRPRASRSRSSRSPCCDAKPLNPERFKKSYLDVEPGQEDPSPVVAWDEVNQKRMQVLLDGAIDLKDQSSRDWNELFNAINRVVLVVPIPATAPSTSRPRPPSTSPPAERAPPCPAPRSRPSARLQAGRHPDDLHRRTSACWSPSC